jgi:hypothetical protein
VHLRLAVVLTVAVPGCRTTPSATQSEPQPVARNGVPTPVVAAEPTAPAVRTTPPPDAKAETPEPPAEPPADGVPEGWEDGSFSIKGIRVRIDHFVKQGEAGHPYVLTGWVQRAGDKPEPHVWITDLESGAGLGGEMMVTGYTFAIPKKDAKRWKDQPKVVLEAGKKYTFIGWIRRKSDGGLAANDGLLVLERYRPAEQHDGAIYPPGAPWHPLEIMRAEMEASKHRR